METFEEIIGKKVRDMRKAAGMSQKKLAESTKTSTQTILRFENAQQWPNPETIKLIFESLKIEPKEIFQDTKSALVLNVITKLPALNEDELRAILDMVNASPSLRLGLSRASNK